MKKLLFLLCLTCSVSLFAKIKVLAFAGSVRNDSYNKKLVQHAAAIARQMDGEVTLIDLKDYPMPIYDADLEAQEGMPDSVKQLRRLMIASDVILIASPQYNASVSSLLKNTLDWASRSEERGSSKEAYQGKKFGIMSASPRKKGGAKGLGHLRTIIEDCGGMVIDKQVSVGNAHEAFNAQGELSDSSTRQELIQEIEVFFR